MKNVYKYDEKDRMIDVETDHAVSKHDDKGNQTEEALYNAKGDLLQKFIYKYDDRGRLIEELYYSPEEMISETVAIRDEIYTQRFYRYNEKDNMVERDKCYSHGCLFEKSIFKYDDKGNVIEEARYDEKGTLTSIDVSSYL